MFIKSFIFFDDTLTFNYNLSRKINFHSSVTINKTPYIIRLYTFRGVSDNIKQTNDRYIETTRRPDDLRNAKMLNPQQSDVNKSLYILVGE
jgi:hypothetical protein